MDETFQLGLPLLQPAQAQKHVTVNEGLARLDGLTQMVLASRTVTTPPVTAADGESYAVPVGAVNDWSTNIGDVAIWSNGGWVFATPVAGWRGFVADEAKTAIHDGQDWIVSAWEVTPNRAASLFEVIEFDHVLGAETVSTTSVVFPENAMAFAVTGTVKTAITGAVTDFDVGISGATSRYGDGIGLTLGTSFVGMAGRPVTYFSDTPIEITANGGDFAGGELRLVLHYYFPTVPSL